jgi:hypothetical protein
MRRTTFGHVLALALVVGWLVPLAQAQETKTARGTVTSLSPGSITVKVAAGDVTYAVDPKTVLEASGAGTAERRADAAGKPGPQLKDFLKVGEAVEVSYTEGGAMPRASRIRRVSSAGGGTDAKSMTQSGTVQSLTGSTLTITGSGGGVSSFTQSFTVNRETRVVAAGAGTAAAASGGGIPIASAVGVGDQVTVTYRQAGATLQAEEVRVTAKKK